MMFRKAVLSASLALLFAGPAMAQTAPAATPAPTAATIPADPALWVVKDKDTTIYLFGTVHVLKPGLSWFDHAVKTAFDKSDQLVLEIPLPDPEEAKGIVLPLAIDSSGKTLTSKIPPANLPAYQAGLAKLGVQPAQLDPLQPWFASISLSNGLLLKSGYNPESGAERTLDAAAKAEHKPVIGLETLSQQLHYFADLPQDEQVKFLLSGIKDADKFDSTIAEMVDDWAKGQPDKLAEVMNRDYDESPLITKTLLTDRNSRWADWINERLKQPGTIFIAVGAGHLAGANSVQAQLAAKYHIKAERIAY
ncbi:TraB/GumN family protein [Sphingomonas sp. GlSt437]|uniref:TraB/GumN family protein n=1 Tax=Sphingomonas sp. GlSt437 TaxID=3389970 RepID=UPI003A8AD1F4